MIDDPSTDSLLLVMEYVEGGTLQPRQVKPGHWELLPEREVWRYVREVLQVCGGLMWWWWLRLEGAVRGWAGEGQLGAR